MTKTLRETIKKIPGSRAIAAIYFDMLFTRKLPKPQRAALKNLLKDSKSQLRQDLFALSCLNFKRDGYFVEFGAADGVHFSNTWLLEKKFGWTGILAEPATIMHENILKKRNAILERDCVWNKTGESLFFRQTENPELSTLEAFANVDFHSDIRKNSTSYEVRTVSLEDMLDRHKSPKIIDFISIDTEGSEFEILECFNFGKYQFNVATIEHNFTSNRERTFKLMKENGYHRLYEDISRFDDWYVHRSLLSPF